MLPSRNLTEQAIKVRAIDLYSKDWGYVLPRLLNTMCKNGTYRRCALIPCFSLYASASRREGGARARRRFSWVMSRAWRMSGASVTIGARARRDLSWGTSGAPKLDWCSEVLALCKPSVSNHASSEHDTPNSFRKDRLCRNSVFELHRVSRNVATSLTPIGTCQHESSGWWFAFSDSSEIRCQISMEAGSSTRPVSDEYIQLWDTIYHIPCMPSYSIRWCDSVALRCFFFGTGSRQASPHRRIDGQWSEACELL